MRFFLRFSTRMDIAIPMFVSAFFLSAFLTLCGCGGFSVGPVHCSWDPQISFFNITFIKNGSHGTIHTFKIYFATVFSIFSKISGIQTDS